MSEEIFNKSLSRFVRDFACKDEVLAKHKRGLDCESIKNELTFKISVEEIEKIIEESNENDDFIRVVDKYGKSSFIKNSK